MYQITFSLRKSYVSKHLLLKHHIRRHPELRPVASAQLENRRNQKYLDKMGASSVENVLLCQSLILQDLINAVIPYEIPEPLQPKGKYLSLKYITFPLTTKFETFPQVQLQNLVYF